MVKRKKHLLPSQTIMLGFAFMILIGTFLLNLPYASKSGESIGFLNALFTATSANCVTGLVVVNTMGHWTLFGKIIIVKALLNLLNNIKMYVPLTLLFNQNSFFQSWIT